MTKNYILLLGHPRIIYLSIRSRPQPEREQTRAPSMKHYTCGAFLLVRIFRKDSTCVGTHTTALLGLHLNKS